MSCSVTCLGYKQAGETEGGEKERWRQMGRKREEKGREMSPDAKSYIVAQLLTPCLADKKAKPGTVPV